MNMHYRHPCGDVEMSDRQLDVWVWHSREKSRPRILICKCLAHRWCLMPWMRALREEKGAQVRVSRRGRASIGSWLGETIEVGRKTGENGVSLEIGEESVSRRQWSTVANVAERLIMIKHHKQKIKTQMAMTFKYICTEHFDFQSSQIHCFIPQVVSSIDSVNTYWIYTTSQT